MLRLKSIGLGVLLGLVCLAASPGKASAQPNPCTASACSRHGTCFVERGTPFCVCDDGYVAERLSCVEPETAQDVLRERRAPGVSDRILMTAQQEIGRAAYGVGKDRTEYPNRLMEYVPHGDWWCSDFVSWVFRAAGVPFSGGYEGGWMIRGNEALQHWFEAQELWVDRRSSKYESFVPQPGDYVRFRTRRGGHSGVVERLDGETLILIEGNYGNRVHRSRFENYKNESSIAGFGMVVLENVPPVSLAGEDQTASLGEPVLLEGEASDDGPAQLLDVTWSRLEGPSAVDFESPFSASTSVHLPDPGTYTLRLRAFDGSFETTDTVSITVLAPEPEVRPPVEVADPASCSTSGRGEGRLPGWPLALLVLFTRKRAGMSRSGD